MDDVTTQDDEARRDEVLRRMLTSTKASSKVQNKGDEQKPAAPKSDQKGRVVKLTSPS